MVAIQSNETYLLKGKIIYSPYLFNTDSRYKIVFYLEKIVKSVDFYYDPLIVHQISVSETKFLERFVVMNQRNSMMAIEENYITNKEFPFTENWGCCSGKNHKLVKIKNATTNKNSKFIDAILLTNTSSVISV